MKLLNENYTLIKTSINERWRLEYGEREEVRFREEETNIFVVNGDEKIKVAVNHMYNGRERDSFTWKWDRDGLKRAFPNIDLSRIQDDSCESGTRKMDWWEPEVQIEKYMNEGVADKYAAKKFGIPDPDDEFEKDFQQHKASKVGNIVANSNGVDIVKNPKSLKPFPANARGVIDQKGNLYLGVTAEDLIHTDMLAALKDKGIIKGKTKGWEDPKDMEDFITVQRLWVKNAFGIGESNMLPKPKRDPEGNQAAKDKFNVFMLKCKKLNPSIKFIPETIRLVARKLLNDDEKQKFMTS